MVIIMLYNSEENKGKYYPCYSLPMLEKLLECGFSSIDRFKNIHTGKTCSIFEITPELSDFLAAWSQRKGSLDKN